MCRPAAVPPARLHLNLVGSVVILLFYWAAEKVVTTIHLVVKIAHFRGTDGVILDTLSLV